MNINNDLYEQLINCPWFENCGIPQQNLTNFPIVWVDKTIHVEKNIASIKWENICLAERNNLSAFLALNHKTEFNKDWNRIVDLIKSEYLSDILSQVKSALPKQNLSDEVLTDIRFNLLSIFLVNHFSQYYKSQFFNNLLQVYLSGHLPCGWKGHYPDGAMRIF